MKQKIYLVLLNRYVISILISLLIIAILPDYFKKFKVSQQLIEPFPNQSILAFNDLNFNNSSEKIIFRNNKLGNACYMVHDNSGFLIDQWNFNGKLLKGSQNNLIEDIDKNGFKEIFLLTQSNDSVFLNINEPLGKNPLTTKEIFIDLVKPFKENPQEATVENLIYINSNKETNQVLITLNTGFSVYPRHIYKLNLNTHELKKSPHLVNKNIITDYHEKNQLIFLQSMSVCNTIDTTYTFRTDYSSWLMVLDKELNFKHEPTDLDIPYSIITSYPIEYNNETKIISLFNTKAYKGIPSTLKRFSLDYKIEKEIKLPLGNYKFLFVNKGKENIIYNSNKGELFSYNQNLELVNQKKVPSNSKVNPIDLDLDGIKEWVLFQRNNFQINIYDSNFENEILITLPDNRNDNLFCGIQFIDKDNHTFYVQKGKSIYHYTYNKNPLYFLKYLIYLGIFLFVLLINYLLIKGYTIQEAKKRALENKISDLQLKTIKSQVDPHFVFNAINTISDMTLMDDKLEADKFIVEFSGFMRQTLNTSDRISCQLQEEIDYCIHYIKLQQIRYQYKFDYSIYIDKQVDRSISIPKHVLYTYIENAIKHGLALQQEKGMLTIEIAQTEKELKLNIVNSGMGLHNTSQNKKYSTGNGLKIMEEIFRLYHKRYKRKITHSLQEIKVTNSVTGVKASIIIPLK